MGQSTPQMHPLYASQVSSLSFNPFAIQSQYQGHPLMNSRHPGHMSMASPTNSQSTLRNSALSGNFNPKQLLTDSKVRPHSAHDYNEDDDEFYGVDVPPANLQINPQLGPTGSMLKRATEVGREKHIRFENGLEELLLTRQNLRSTRGYFAKITPIIERDLKNIRQAIQVEFDSGLNDKSKTAFLIIEEKQYFLIVQQLVEYRKHLTGAIDTLRKKNTVTKEEFSCIINLANAANTWAKSLSKEIPLKAWNVVIENKEAELYMSLIAKAQKDVDVKAILTRLEGNLGNPSFKYISPFENLAPLVAPTRAVSIVQGPINSKISESKDPKDTLHRAPQLTLTRPPIR